MRVREAASLGGLDEATVIQREVWNLADLDITSRIQLRASQHAGGSVLVAEDESGVIAGFSYAFPGFTNGRAYWHSDMLAVRPAYRGSGVGQALKWAQRHHALREGIARITWTFDPMQAGNAHLNLELLGATASEYLQNFYGVTTSALHHGLPTDRLLADWDLESPRVEVLARGEAPLPIDEVRRIEIPSRWNDLASSDAERARRDQGRVAREFTAAFADGCVAAGFDKAASAYRLSLRNRS
jgi:predicted GNAT superfamily acetyltransferase